MKQHDTLGDRMKQYEECFNVKLPRRCPLVVRLDGRAFHSWTRRTHCVKPFDDKLMRLMAETTKFLCDNVGGCVLGYTQSDEISLLLRDDQSFESVAWFDKRLQKITSLAASMATYYFTVNNSFEKKYPAYFDARAFLVPHEDVRAYFIWRQNDATKNSLSMLAQSLYTQSELVGKRREALMDLCWVKGANWNDLSTPKKRGYVVRKCPIEVQGKYGPVTRMKFLIDEDTQIFSSDEGKKLFDELCYRE